ncbi:LIM and calponin homology domains-containing protein 1-like [Cynoglossus semilaevis]|uniref:LIM and calponin homology domains-containing protein 1-like n=1 Tax=Cynoglossus semilaevis TaxID=244447 RepID=UPI000D62CFBB|nr:LIM and calponin homology domains-containing protein 1-like [Cynoglossus semilaevis]
MEQVLTGEPCTSIRRRSIKTYRQIVEEKERREEELREAYRRARTQEEASAVLQRYAQRFSISEAVLESLQLPKLLDRSISADPSFPGSPFPLSLTASPTTPDPFDEDPNGPLRFLRQQSAPAPSPKFTSTLEARIEEFPKDFQPSQPRPQIRSRSSEPPSSRTLSPKPVPLLMPKPYFESTVRDVSETLGNRVSSSMSFYQCQTGFGKSSPAVRMNASV